MHIALFAPAWPPDVYPNGVVTYVNAMREELRRRGHFVSILAGRLGRAEDGVHEVEISLGRKARQWLKRRRVAAAHPAVEWGEVLADNIARLHRHSTIDVVEMEESFGWSQAVQRQVAVPVVVKLHGPSFVSLVEEELQSDLGRLKILREGAALSEARCILSPSAATLQETLHRYDLRPAIARHVVNPISLPASTPLWSLDTCNRETILFVGRFDKRKGGDLVLQAFASLLRTRPAMRLIFVGPDAGVPAADGRAVHVEEMIRQLLPGPNAARVDYRGVLGGEEVCRLRAQAFVTIVASRWENHSYTALEAMLQGCPLVSSDAGGQPEFVLDGVTGLLAKAGDAADLCEKILSLVDSPELAAELGREARRHVLAHHNPALVVDQTLSVYREAAALDWGRA